MLIHVTNSIIELTMINHEKHSISWGIIVISHISFV